MSNIPTKLPTIKGLKPVDLDGINKIFEEFYKSPHPNTLKPVSNNLLSNIWYGIFGE